MDFKKILFYTVLFFVVMLAFLVRLWPMQYAHWWDETVYLQNAEVLYSGRDNYNEFAFRPPLLSILFSLAFLIKHHAFTASIVVALVSTMASIFAFLIGKELYDMKTGVLAGLLMAFTPFIVENSRYIMTDVPSLSLICLGTYFLISGHKRNRSYHHFFSGLFFSLSVLMRFTSLILLFVVPFYFIIQKINFKKIVPLGFGFTFGMLPYLIWAQFSQNFFLQPFINARRAASGGDVSTFFYITNFLDVYPFVILVGLILWILYTFLSINLESHKAGGKIVFTTTIQRGKNLKRADVVFLIWAIVVLAYFTKMPNKELRYILPMALPLIILSSRGLVYFIGSKKKIIQYSSVFLVALLSIAAFAPSFSRLSDPFINTYQTEEMLVSQYLSATYPDHRLYLNHNYPVFAYYTQFETIKIENQDESFYSVFPKNMEYPGLLVVYKELKHPTLEWINSEGVSQHFKKAKEFEKIVVYEYSP